MKIAICLMAIVMMAMNVLARQYGFGAKVFKPRSSKVVVRTEGRCVREVMKTGETMVKAGVSAKKIESAGKAVGYAMVGGAAVVAAHSMTSESRAKGKGIDDWNKRIEEEFVKLPQEEQKKLMKDVIEKNFEVGWGEVVGAVSIGCLVVVVLLAAFVSWKNTMARKSDSQIA